MIIGSGRYKLKLYKKKKKNMILFLMFVDKYLIISTNAHFFLKY